jgi:hypothetical protein
LPNADGTIESPSPEGNPLTQIAEHHIPLHLSLTSHLSSHNYSSRSGFIEPAFQVIRIWIRIQSGSRVSMTKNSKRKKYCRNLFLSFLIKNRNLLLSKLQEKHSAHKREHLALQK